MSYVSPVQLSQAKEVDLLTYLQTCEPQELVHVSGDTYCTRTHDSLKISNGKWHWWSRGIGGRSALDYLIKVQGYSLPQAAEIILGREAIMPPISRSPPQEAEPRKLLMPELNSNTRIVRRYLEGRGIHSSIIDYCTDHNLLFETKQHHNALFAGYDQEGSLRYAALRGTRGNFKGEVTGSDKHYSFSIPSSHITERLHVFESAIDLLSYVTLALQAGQNWRKMNLLSMAGFTRPNVRTLCRWLLDSIFRTIPTSKLCIFTWTTMRLAGAQQQASRADCPVSISCWTSRRQAGKT